MRPALPFLAGVVPLLAAAGTGADAPALGAATIAAAGVTGVAVWSLRRLTGHDVRMPAIALVVVAAVAAIALVVRAFAPGAHATLAPFLPLVAIPCALAGAAVAARHVAPVDPARAIGAVLGAFVALLAVGALRTYAGPGAAIAGTFLAPAALLASHRVLQARRARRDPPEAAR